MIIYKIGWWFGTFFMFPYIENSHLNRLLYFFRGGETTNQKMWGGVFSDKFQWQVKADEQESRKMQEAQAAKLGVNQKERWVRFVPLGLHQQRPSMSKKQQVEEIGSATGQEMFSKKQRVYLKVLYTLW